MRQTVSQATPARQAHSTCRPTSFLAAVSCQPTQRPTTPAAQGGPSCRPLFGVLGGGLDSARRRQSCRPAAGAAGAPAALDEAAGQPRGPDAQRTPSLADHSTNGLLARPSDYGIQALSGTEVPSPTVDSTAATSPLHQGHSNNGSSGSKGSNSRLGQAEGAGGDGASQALATLAAQSEPPVPPLTGAISSALDVPESEPFLGAANFPANQGVSIAERRASTNPQQQGPQLGSASSGRKPDSVEDEFGGAEAVLQGSVAPPSAPSAPPAVAAALSAAQQHLQQLEERHSAAAPPSPYTAEQLAPAASSEPEVPVLVPVSGSSGHTVARDDAPLMETAGANPAKEPEQEAGGEPLQGGPGEGAAVSLQPLDAQAVEQSFGDGAPVLVGIGGQPAKEPEQEAEYTPLQVGEGESNRGSMQPPAEQAVEQSVGEAVLDDRPMAAAVEAPLGGSPAEAEGAAGVGSLKTRLAELDAKEGEPDTATDHSGSGGDPDAQVAASVSLPCGQGGEGNKGAAESEEAEAAVPSLEAQLAEPDGHPAGGQQADSGRQGEAVEQLGERPGGQQVEVVPEVQAAAAPLTTEEQQQLQEQLQRELGWRKGLEDQEEDEDEGTLEDEALGAAAEDGVGSLEALLAELDAGEEAAVVDEGAGGLQAGLAGGAAGPGTGGGTGEQTLVHSGELTLTRSCDSCEGAVEVAGGLSGEQEQEEDEEEGGIIEGLWDGVDETAVAISVAAAAAAAEAEAALMAQHEAPAVPAGYAVPRGMTRRRTGTMEMRTAQRPPAMVSFEGSTLRELQAAVLRCSGPTIIDLGGRIITLGPGAAAVGGPAGSTATGTASTNTSSPAAAPTSTAPTPGATAVQPVPAAQQGKEPSPAEPAAKPGDAITAAASEPTAAPTEATPATSATTTTTTTALALTSSTSSALVAVSSLQVPGWSPVSLRIGLQQPAPGSKAQQPQQPAAPAGPAPASAGRSPTGSIAFGQPRPAAPAAPDASVGPATGSGSSAPAARTGGAPAAQGGDGASAKAGRSGGGSPPAQPQALQLSLCRDDVALVNGTLQLAGGCRVVVSGKGVALRRMEVGRAGHGAGRGQVGGGWQVGTAAYVGLMPNYHAPAFSIKATLCRSIVSTMPLPLLCSANPIHFDPVLWLPVIVCVQVVDAEASGWWRQAQALPGTLQPALVSVAAGGSLELDDCSLLAGGRDRDVLRAEGKGQDQAPAVAAAARAGRSGSHGGGALGGSGEASSLRARYCRLRGGANSCVASLGAAVHLDCCVLEVGRRGMRKT